MENTGLNIVITGKGKGKTTSSLGMIIRALGQGQKVCFIQFIKSPDLPYGEKKILDQLGVENYQMGAGFTWVAEKQDTIDTTRKAWDLAVDKIMSNAYDLIVLDEVNHLLNFTKTVGTMVVTPEETVELMAAKPPRLNLVFTGRYAHPLVIEAADTVSDVQCVKHHYQKGVKAARGVEY